MGRLEWVVWKGLACRGRKGGGLSNKRMHAADTRRPPCSFRGGPARGARTCRTTRPAGPCSTSCDAVIHACGARDIGRAEGDCAGEVDASWAGEDGSSRGM